MPPEARIDKQAGMAAFDFIDSAARAYKFAWQERKVILRLALFPFLLKLGSFTLLTAMGLEQNYLRQGLFLIPSYFAEGWLIAQVIRMGVYGEFWPVPLDGDRQKDAALLAARARSISAATILYVLTKLALAFFSGMVLTKSARQASSGIPESDPVLFIIGLAALMLTVWLFRFLWLYVPAALDYPVMDFLKRTKGTRASLAMIGTWLLCFVPLAFVLIIAAQVFAALFPGPGDDLSPISTYTVVAAQALTETIAALVSSLGIAYGVHTLYQDPGRKNFL